MHASICLRLPFLRDSLPDVTRSSAQAPHWPGALRIWPGLPQQEDIPLNGRYCPPDYPFSPAQARACLEDLRNMDATALSGLPLEATAGGNARAGRLMAEMACLENLSALAAGQNTRTAEIERRQRLTREQAQKALLWIWLQEERLAELAGLTVRVAQNARALSAVLEESTSSIQGLSFLGPDLSLDLSLVPPWRLSVVNAACFLPDGASILAEGQMREDLLERLTFTPAPQYATLLACPDEESGRILAASASLWQALGRSIPDENAPLYDLLRKKFLWLTWQEEA